jgi:four helix bundle protein
MSAIEKFEDLLCWQKARELTREIYKNFKDGKDFGFKDQIQRAAFSVVSNIAEGFESGTKEEFVNYLYIAKASAGEVRSQLYIASDVGYLNIETFKYLNNLAKECSRLIHSFVTKVKMGARRGLQHKHPKKPLEEWWHKYGLIRLPDGRFASKNEAPNN